MAFSHLAPATRSGALHHHHHNDYHHNEPEPHTAPHTQSPAQARCVASKFRTKLCDKWLENGGNCRYGARCMFAHGPHELRSTEMNLRDGLTNEETIRVFKRYVQLRNAGVEVQLPNCLRNVDWGAGRRFVLNDAPTTELAHRTQSIANVPEWASSEAPKSPMCFRWCPYSTRQCKVHYFDDGTSDTPSLASGSSTPFSAEVSGDEDRDEDFEAVEYEI